jgi:hypothetical protein
MIERRMIIKGTNGVWVKDWTSHLRLIDDKNTESSIKEMDRRIIEGNENPNIVPRILSYVIQERVVTDWEEKA